MNVPQDPYMQKRVSSNGIMKKAVMESWNYHKRLRCWHFDHYLNLYFYIYMFHISTWLHYTRIQSNFTTYVMGIYNMSPLLNSYLIQEWNTTMLPGLTDIIHSDILCTHYVMRIWLCHYNWTLRELPHVSFSYKQMYNK